METTTYAITIDTITYTDFPTYPEINKLRPDVVSELVIFFRMVGLCSMRQINQAIGNDEKDYRIQWMIKHAEAPDVDESESETNIEYTKGVQREILGNDNRPYRIKVSDIATKLHLMSCHTIVKAIESVIREQQKGLGPIKTEKEGAKEMKTPVTTKTEASVSSGHQVGAEVESEITEIVANCPIRPIHDYQKVRKDKEYLEKLVAYFPRVTANMIAKYLFHEKVSMPSVNTMFFNNHVSRSKVNFHEKQESAYERVAFVAWAEGDWRQYMAEEGLMASLYEKAAPQTIREEESAPTNDEPATPAKEEKTAPAASPTTEKDKKSSIPRVITEEKACAMRKAPTQKTGTTKAQGIAEEPAIKPDETSQSSAHRRASATLTISGSLGEILQVLTYINKESKAELEEFYVK